MVTPQPSSRPEQPEAGDRSYRVQLRRTKGWRAPAGTIVCTRASARYGNPHRVEELGRDEAVRRHDEDLHAGRLPVTVDDVRRDLAGHPLACFCPLDAACHVDNYLRIINNG